MFRIRVAIVAFCFLFALGAGAKSKTLKNARIHERLKKIILPRIAFEDTPVTTVFQYLKKRSRALDPDGVGVNFVVILNKGKKAQVEFVKKNAAEDDDEGFGDDDDGFGDEDEKTEKKEETTKESIVAPVKEPTVTLDFNNMPLGTAIRYICNSAGLRYKVEDHAVVILGPGVTQANLELRIFSVDPRLFRNIKDIKKFFEEKGVSFPTSTAK